MKYFKLVFLVMFLVIFVPFQSCKKYCELFGEYDLGNSFYLVESDKDHRTINYCTSGMCCDVSILIVPSNITHYNFDSKWLIAKQTHSSSEYYWIINKKINLKFEYDTDMKSRIFNYVLGPLDYNNFLKKMEENQISLKFKSSL